MAREPRVTIEVRIVPPSTPAVVPSAPPSAVPDAPAAPIRSPSDSLCDPLEPFHAPPVPSGASPGPLHAPPVPFGASPGPFHAPPDLPGASPGPLHAPPDLPGASPGLLRASADPLRVSAESLHASPGPFRDLPGIAADVAAQAGLTSPVVLLAHDGPEYERVAGLSNLFPSLHVALLSPGRRNEWYSANPAYAHALVHEVLPALPGRVVVGLGASLGGLALLHAETLYPGSFAGLFLQSGSFFTAELDPQEAGFPWYRRILDFVQNARPVAARVVLTCGRDEENLLNNRAMAARLGVPLLEVPGGHSMLTWRDALDPHLRRLLQEVNDDRRPARPHAGAAPGDA